MRRLPNGLHGFFQGVHKLCLVLPPALSGVESSKQGSRVFKGVHKLFFSIVSNSSANLYLATSSHQLEFYL